MERKKMLIGGEWVEARSGEWSDNVNPHNGEIISQVPKAGPEDVDLAVDKAYEAYYETWSKVHPADRAKLMFKLADAIEQATPELARMESLDMGKPLSQSTGEIPATADTFRYFAGLADKIEGEVLVTPDDTFGYTLREPFGVVASITPWNFPILILSIKGAPALAAGNCIIFKPASSSPSTALEVGRLAQEVGFPPGVVQVVTGEGGAMGSRLAGNPKVGKVTFTGSTEVGRKIIQASANNIAKVTLELGGKTANVVLPDADMDMAVAAAARTIFLNCGQICTAASRLLVHENIKDEFLARLVKIAESIKVGDPFDPATKVGPISSRQQYETVLEYLKLGKAEGARIITGGEKPEDPALARGLYIKPTIFDGVCCDMKIAREEIFGPVLSVLTFKDDDEAVRLANDSDFGLAAALWTTNLSKAHKIAARLEAGIIWINCTNVFGAWMPYGGYKTSGLGFEAGIEGLKEFTRLKTVLIDTSDTPNTWAYD